MPHKAPGKIRPQAFTDAVRPNTRTGVLVDVDLLRWVAVIDCDDGKQFTALGRGCAPNVQWYSLREGMHVAVSVTGPGQCRIEEVLE